MNHSDTEQIRSVVGESGAQQKLLETDPEPPIADKAERRPKIFLYVVTGLASLGAILLGYDVGVMSGAILFIEEDFGLTTFESEAIVGSLNLISFIGALISGKVADAIGRKWTIALSSTIFLAASVLMALAPGFWILLIGRLVAGIGVGSALVLPPIYIAEIAPPKYRGKLVTVSEICQNVGILLGYVAGFFLAPLPDGINWRVMLGLGAVPALFMLTSLLCIPESPRWLVKEGKLDKARTALRRTYYDDEIEPAILEMDANVKRERKINAQAGWKDLICPTPAVRLMLISGVGAAFYQQASGSEAAVYYTPKILEQSGMTDHRDKLAATMVVGAFKTTTLIISAMVIDKFGRRPMFLASIITVTISLCLLGTNFLFGSPIIGSIAGMCLYMIGFGMGIGPVGWLLIAEIFPVQLRGRAMSIGTAVNRIVSGTVALTFLTLTETIGQSGAFFFYAGVSFTGVLFALVFVPETKHKSLEEIIVEFEVSAKSGDLSVIRKAKRH